MRRDLTTRDAIERSAAQLGIADPEAAYLLLNKASVTHDADGQPQRVEVALRDLLKARPYLAGQTRFSTLLRVYVIVAAGLLGRDYSSSQMSYDLRCLRLHGLIQRNPGTNYYTLTSEGIRVAVFYTKLHGRLLRPLLEADQPPAPIELRRALGTIDHVLGDYITGARLGTAA